MEERVRVHHCERKVDPLKVELSYNDPKTVFENNVGKGDNASYQHFPLFPHYFVLLHR